MGLDPNWLGLDGEYAGDAVGDWPYWPPYGDIAGLLGDPGEPGWLGDQIGDRPDASDAPDGEKLGPPGVIPLATWTTKR